MPSRLLIVDDSPLYRLRLSQIFAASDQLQIVGLACDGREAIRMITERRAEVVLLDLEMPELDGFSVLRWAMKNEPLPIVVCSGRTERESVFQALEAGAVDFITKPELRYAIRSEEFAQHLRTRVEAAAEAHTRVTNLSGDVETSALIAATQFARADAKSYEPSCLVGIVGSAGSPAAVSQIVSRLRPDLSAPLIVALHMPHGFTKSFAERLTRTSKFIVTEARDGEALESSHIYVAPGGRHTMVTTTNATLRFRVTQAGARDFYAPSADLLLESMAQTSGDGALGVVLTGMGNDGLRGAQAIHEHGGRVIIEARETAIVWGMPRVVSEAGLADAELSPAAIAAALPLLCHQA